MNNYRWRGLCVKEKKCLTPGRVRRPDDQGDFVIDDTLLEAEEKMEKAVAVAREDFAGIRTGRAHPAMFNKIQADYYGFSLNGFQNCLPSLRYQNNSIV